MIKKFADKIKNIFSSKHGVNGYIAHTKPFQPLPDDAKVSVIYNNHQKSKHVFLACELDWGSNQTLQITHYKEVN